MSGVNAARIININVVERDDAGVKKKKRIIVSRKTAGNFAPDALAVVSEMYGSLFL
mgnify:CR=1 FL=1